MGHPEDQSVGPKAWPAGAGVCTRVPPRASSWVCAGARLPLGSGVLWCASLTHQHSGFSRPSWSRCGARPLCLKAGPVPCWGPRPTHHPVPVDCPLQAYSPRARGSSWNAVFLHCTDAQTSQMSRLRSRDLRLPPALLLPCGLALARQNLCVWMKGSVTCSTWNPGAWTGSQPPARSHVECWEAIGAGRGRARWHRLARGACHTLGS